MALANMAEKKKLGNGQLLTKTMEKSQFFFGLFEHLVFIAWNVVFSLINIVKDIALACMAKNKKNIWKNGQF